MASPTPHLANPTAMVDETVLAVQRPVVLLGIGGAGMNPLATLLCHLGYTVLGSDSQAMTSPALQQLANLGVTLLPQTETTQLPPDALVVISTAIKPTHPQRQWAESRQKPHLCWHRSDLLAALLHTALAQAATQAKASYTWVGISGTHGKTTLTGWVGYLLQQTTQAVAVLAGGRLPYAPEGGNLFISPHYGQQGHAFAVAELDESDGTLVRYRPPVFVIANLELDHADHYGQGTDTLFATFDTTLKGLVRHAETYVTHPLPTVVVWAGCANTVAVVAPYVEVLRVLWVGEAAHLANVPTTKLTQNIALTQVQAQPNGTFTGELDVATSLTLNPALLGYHSLSNAALACVATWACGVEASAIEPHIAGFSGMGRRFETLLNTPALTVIDDYAHHPTEIEATLKAARAAYPGHKLVALCQPHRFSRLATFMQGFAQSLALADAVGLIDVYPAGEDPALFTHATTAILATHVKGLPVACLGEASQLATALTPWLATQRTEGQAVLLLNMGAGNNSTGLKAWLAKL